MIKRLDINDHTIEFINSSHDTRNGFKHCTALYIDDDRINFATCYYYNRTWESYAYQTVMKQCVNIELGKEKNRLKDQYKTEHNYKRLTKERLNDFNIYLGRSAYYQLLQSIYNAL